MKLPTPPFEYDRNDQSRMRGELEVADGQNIKRQSSVTYLLMSKADGTVGKLTINSSGTPIWTAL